MADARPGLRIDRLVLDMPGGTAASAERVASLVTAALASAEGLPQAGDLPTLRISVSGGRDTDPSVLARRIVAALLRDLARQA
jgi:hypothetical protein